MKRTETGKSERQKIHDKNRKQTNLAYSVLFGIVVIGLLIAYIVLNALDGFSVSDFIKDIFGNLMGVLAAFLIFDVVRDKMTQDTYAEEVSQQLLETLLSKDEAMQALNEDMRKKFIGTALVSLDEDKEAAEQIADVIDCYLTQGTDRKRVLEVLDTYSEAQKKVFVDENVRQIMKDDDAVDMIRHFLGRYLIGNNACGIKTSFHYSFELRDSLPDVFNVLKNREDYFYVQETLTYDVKYLNESANNLDSEILRIGFAYDNESLDRFLRDNQRDQDGNALNNCIFRESLDIDAENIAYFENLTPEELKTQFIKMFRPHLVVDGIKGELVSVIASGSGIVTEFRVGHDRDALSHNVDIIFHMPKRWGGILEVALVEPTKQPKISLSYQEDSMHVDMYSFLNKGDNSSYDNTHEKDNGVYRILLNNEWVYPISGIVFAIDQLKKTP